MSGVCQGMPFPEVPLHSARGALFCVKQEERACITHPTWAAAEVRPASRLDPALDSQPCLSRSSQVSFS